MRVLIHKVTQARVNVPRRDAVDSSKVTPLVGQRLRHVDAAGFSHVVGGLFLRKVGDVARHGGSNDKRAGAALLEMMPNGFGAVKGTGEIGGNDFLPGLNRAVKDTGVGSTAGIGNEAIDLLDMLELLTPYFHVL